MNPPKRILYTVLNWGLGHAARSIPIINALLEQNIEIILASDGVAFHLLEKEFPQLPIVTLPAYNIRYPSDNMVWSIAPQLPKILKAILQENRYTVDLVRKHKINGIISDSRFGCYHATLPTVFISHQLSLKMPNKLLSKLANNANRFWLKKFKEIWVPDINSTQNLSGDLSLYQGLKKVYFLGIHSRMSRTKNVDIQYDAIAVLSGPEPQRTFLQKELIQKFQKLEGKYLVVCGRTDEQYDKNISKNIRLVSFMTTKELNQAILNSRFVITRSGYTTLLDLAHLQKRAILIPTPGQTEQIYLAERLANQKSFVIQTQGNINITQGLKALENTSTFSNLSSSNLELEYRIQKWLESF